MVPKGTSDADELSHVTDGENVIPKPLNEENTQKPSADVKQEDDAINSKNMYHKSNKKIDLRSNVFENVILLFVILIPIIGMYALFRFNKNKCIIGGQDKSNTMFSLLTVSLLMTTAESIFVYWYNIQRTYNNIKDKLDKKIGFEQYISMKSMNDDIPNVVHTEFKKSYEKNLQSITFIMLLPILLICIFMMSLLTGCMNVGYRDVLGILVNVLLLVVVFGVTFVNLGMKQSAPVNFKEIADTFDPLSDVHRFQTKYSFLSNRDIIGMFSGLMGGIIAFVAFVYKYK
ncbi:MAG: hypothetical protein CL842_05545 [Crocinitomicaceae bacterium]|nr:hypothetical protein [Crocinitomicaceae bacterium]